MTRRRRRPTKKRSDVIPRAEAGRIQTGRAQPWRSPGQLRIWVFLGLLFALALVLRAFNLTAQSLWADEGNSVRLVERPLRLVIDAARADVHPPGYYLVLWGWGRVFGQGEAAVRALSVAIGVALVGMAYVLGSRVYGARAGWLGAFCAAVSPFQVQYSQEVRMYILVAFLGLVAVYAWMRWLENAGMGWSVLYVAATAAGFWTHYSFPIVTVSLNVAWVVWWLRRRDEGGQGRLLLSWIGMHLVVLILYLPWLPTAWSRIFGYGPISEQYSVSFIAAQALKLLSLGETVPDDDLTRWLTLGMVVLAVLGAWGGFSSAGHTSARRRRPWLCTLALVLLVLAPIVMMVGLALVGRPAYRPKFFLVASPPFCLLVGAGIAWLEGSSGRRTIASRLWLLAGMAVIGVGAARSLRNYYFDPAYARSDYRAIAAYIESMEREGDAVLLNAPNQWEVFTYYHHQHVPVYPLNRTRPPIEADVVAELEEIAAKHDRLFVLYWAVDESDPDRIVERWLEAHTFKAADTWYGEVRLVIYAVPEALEAVDMEKPLKDVRLGADIALRGYTLSPEKVQRGDILQVTLFWEALAVPGNRYKVFLHLVDMDGQIVAQYDGEPGHGMDLTTDWSPDRGIFPDRYGVLVPATLPDGSYRLLMGLYDVTGSPRLPITVDWEFAGDSLLLATIDIE